MSALTLSWAMELYGYEVRTCYDGRSAVQVAHEFHPEVVLLDIGMPVMDGYEVCRELRNDASLCGTRIVAQSGWGDPEARRRTAEAGFDLHLTKPLDLGVVKALIDHPAMKRDRN
ncbi:response regulator [Asticcacaulis solisilvae]|uniref:response regulator n=1 Tax=Asticcacaulis solisilvae TaxID=1217274 RepID=UPI003FD7807D